MNVGLIVLGALILVLGLINIGVVIGINSAKRHHAAWCNRPISAGLPTYHERKHQ